jgi:hypothetical protein
MLVSNKKSIEDIVVEILAKSPYIKGPDLVIKINEIRPKTSKQAIYTALKFLLENEVVAKVGSEYFISRLWLNKLSKLFETQKEKEISEDAIFNLKEGESISYYFPNLLTCDTYWGHIVNILIDWVPGNCPIFIWNPHNFFIVGRNEIEKDIFKAFERKNKYGFYITRGKTELDVNFKKTWTSKFVSINTDDVISFNDFYYLNIFGDLIVEVFLNKQLVSDIDVFYSKNHEITLENKLFFKSILEKKHSVRMKISRNKSKAAKLRKKMSKNFFIPKSLIIS